MRCVATFVGLLLLAGCGRGHSRTPTAPLNPAQSAAQTPAPSTDPSVDWRKFDSPDSLLFPLTVGNRWHYLLADTTWTFIEGDSLPRPPEVYRDEFTVDVESARTTPAGIYYRLEHSLLRFYSLEYRQDRTGLYQLTAIVGENSPASLARGINPFPPANGPIGPELALLRYPLRRGMRWDEGGFPLSRKRTVEGVDVLDLPMGRVRGYRIRVGNPDPAASDTTRIWYGRCGELLTVSHLAYPLRDRGRVIGHVLRHETATLDSVRLVNCRPDCPGCP